MAMTNAEREAAYRARHVQRLDGCCEQIHAVVSVTAKRTLKRLAACYGVNQRVILEHLLRQAEHAAGGKIRNTVQVFTAPDAPKAARR